MKYLITGGAGFIGIKLTEKLIKNKKNKIYIIDNFSKKTDNESLLKILKNKNVKLIQKDYDADILFWDIDNLNEIPYWFNSPRISKIIKAGKLLDI